MPQTFLTFKSVLLAFNGPDNLLHNPHIPCRSLSLPLQYFFGKPATVEQKGRDGSAANEKGDPTGEYTFVLKHA